MNFNTSPNCLALRKATNEENSLIFPDVQESPVPMSVTTPPPKPTQYRRSRTKSLDADISLLPSLFKEKEAKLRKNAAVPKMKNLSRVISVLEVKQLFNHPILCPLLRLATYALQEELHPTDREIAQEHEITCLLKNESNCPSDSMETEASAPKCNEAILGVDNIQSAFQPDISPLTPQSGE
ncbi:hypothetical protein K493DRAFT_387471 [Basidiobolus meristosporus CBS 931.73]|uniref:Uncharacterized protein n=1 Tax=Basidiobolus meristosporus CBS 931.73 TaxID=1314790 RepID=A0A1Y1XF36_9FUNG|nr:hypothetical protein K493DRAFT_387471 [Basidiobolus meristosporus CBS 931.73]|eukprot:ORX84355.1 hypothetical protein K493DRAFT_387471 [Basidiobolus meristosporus CBS 931.73]